MIRRLLGWLQILLDYFFRRGVKKGVAAGSAQGRAEQAEKHSEQVEKSMSQIIKEKKKSIAEAREAREKWKSLHRF